MKVRLTQDDGTIREAEATQALVIYQDARSEIQVMGECTGLFIQVIEVADIIGQAARKQSTALAAKRDARAYQALRDGEVDVRSGSPDFGIDYRGGLVRDAGDLPGATKASRAKDITGKTFAYLTALEKRDGDNWLFRCELCRTEIEAYKYSVMSGGRKSCGCLKERRYEKYT